MSPRPRSLGVPCTLRFAVSKSSPSGNHPARLRGVPRGSGESKVTTASTRGPLLARGTGEWGGEGGGPRHALHRTAAHIRTTSASTGTRGGCPRSRLGTCVAAAPRARVRLSLQAPGISPDVRGCLGFPRVTGSPVLRRHPNPSRPSRHAPGEEGGTERSESPSRGPWGGGGKRNPRRAAQNASAQRLPARASPALAPRSLSGKFSGGELRLRGAGHAPPFPPGSSFPLPPPHPPWGTAPPRPRAAAQAPPSPGNR